MFFLVLTSISFFFFGFILIRAESRACLKIHSRHLYASLCGKLGSHSVNVAHYASLIRAKFPTNCDAHLTESNFQTRSGVIVARMKVKSSTYI